MQERFGFVYIWYDRKHKMYYIGSHWGTEDDGYVCSSNRMRKAYRRRPDDFKRRILSRVYSDRLSLLDEEQRWFDMVKDRSRYYNLNFEVQKLWWSDPDSRLTVGQKITKTKMGKFHSAETKAKIAVAKTGSKHSEHSKIKMSRSKQGVRQSDETKAKISATLKSLPFNEEAVRKMNEARRKTYSFMSDKGLIYTTTNLSEFCVLHNLAMPTIRKLIGGSYCKASYKGWQFISKE